MTIIRQYLEEVSSVALSIDYDVIERIVCGLVALRDRGGRLFILGVGGSAANASHAVGDFRKMAEIEAYTPADNVAELTARTNDEGWPTVFDAWLRTSKADADDAIMVLSVGGGDADRNVSPNIVHALDEAKRRGLKIYGIVGREGGYTAQVGDEVLIVPTVAQGHITAHTESFQSVLLHGMTCHPRLMTETNKWETIDSEKVQRIR